ncbi:MAG: glucose-1-phosphate cytidylyltransferase [Elusimicrobia bacterium]|nr:glucose-1-phosphate cytidylyltransferase [Elusimicrobiota bacterium]
MKTVILAGGLGTRLSEETIIKPKPMVEIGNKPIMLHIMNTYASYGYKEFILALGYLGEIVKEYFLNYYYHQNNLTIDLKIGKTEVLNENCSDWKVHLIDTGLETMTGGRLFRLRDFLKGQSFMLTYGDGVANIDIKKLVAFHKAHGKVATVTAVRPVARFGGIILEKEKVKDFKEKPQTVEGWINGGFFVFEPKIFDYLHSDTDVLEGEPMEKLVKDGQLMAYQHEGFWQCMDTVRDKHNLENMWISGKAPWIK